MDEDAMAGRTRRELKDQFRKKTTEAGICALENIHDGRMLLMHTKDLESSKNRFDFAVSTGLSVYPRIEADWKKLGPAAFRFVALEIIRMPEGATESSFEYDLKFLEEVWAKKLGKHKLY